MSSFDGLKGQNREKHRILIPNNCSDGPEILPTQAGLRSVAHHFNPVRLTIARELRGLAKGDLAGLVQKTPGAISQFESGKTSPDYRTVAALALALQIPPSFLAAPGGNRLTLDDCHFRSLRSASQRDRKRLLARGSILCDLLDVLDEQVEFPEDKLTEVQRSVNLTNEIEEYALDLRNHWGLGQAPIAHMIRLIETKGAIVTWVPEECGEVDAFSTWHQARPLVFLMRDKDSPSRTRLDSAHELGHLLMHMDASPGNPDLERQAYRFAGAFLLPRDQFLAECPKWLDLDHYYELKKRWKVSVQAMLRRAYELGRLSEASYRRACIQINKRGERRCEPFEPSQEEPVLLRNAIDVLGGPTAIDSIGSYLPPDTLEIASVA